LASEYLSFLAKRVPVHNIPGPIGIASNEAQSYESKRAFESFRA
jgi:hypothetical protein